MHVGQGRFGRCLPQVRPLCGANLFGFTLDRVKQRDAAQCIGGDRAAVGGMQFEEFTSYVGQAGELSHACLERGLVAAEIINHELTAPVLEEGACVGACAPALVIKHDDGRPFVQIVGAVGRAIAGWLAQCQLHVQ